MFSSNLNLLPSATTDNPSFDFKTQQQNHRRKSSFSPSDHLPTSNKPLDPDKQNADHTDQNEGHWNQAKKREVYRFQSDWLVSSLAWSNEFGQEFNLAISSYIEDYNNYVKIIRLAKDAYEQELEDVTTFIHPYPATKILWIPRPINSLNPLPQLIATTADYLRLWRVRENGSQESYQTKEQPPQKEVQLECLLNNNKGKKHCDPLTSFDWNEIDPSIIVTASVDTTVAVWDIEVGKQVDNLVTRPESSASLTGNNAVTSSLKTKLYLHEQEVYDISFSRAGSGKDVFASAGADGCVRLFDLRSLRSSSTVLYEANDQATPGDKKALVRVGCNKRDSNLVSTFAINSNEILILDVRYNGKGPMASLSNHTNNLNSMSWAPHSGHHICSAADDQQALIWELSKLPNPIEEPLLAYQANGKINTISWSASQSDWIAIGYENYMELLRV